MSPQDDAVKCSRMFRFLNASHFLPDCRHIASLFKTSAHRTVSMLSAAQVKTTATPGTSSAPPPSPDSRSSFDGWRPKPRHDRRPRVPAHRLRAYQPANPVKLSRLARTSAHSSVGACFSSALPIRCVLCSVMHCGPTLSRTPTRATRTPC